MIDKHDALYNDFEAVRKISIVPLMLDVICRTTGLGFAAIARVTENRWLACSVRDEVAFGLQEGGELQIETTICNEIRDHQNAVIIDHVDKDELYKDHHTPKLYGLQSYISYPIVLKNGEFFGTLCAIGTEPAKLNDAKITGTFKLFSELLSFHLQSIKLIERSHSVLKETDRQLSYSDAENKLYQQIMDHNLQEPLRKIQLFSDMLMSDAEHVDATKVKKTATKINMLAKEFTTMIQHISKFSTLESDSISFEQVDLNEVIESVRIQLKTQLKHNNIILTHAALPVITGVPLQMEQLFFYLVHHAIAFSTKDSSSDIYIYPEAHKTDEWKNLYTKEGSDQYCTIVIKLKGNGAEKYSIHRVFDIFLHLNNEGTEETYGAGLAYCRKIVHRHGGSITAQTIQDEGISFTIVLPVGNTTNN